MARLLEADWLAGPTRLADRARRTWQQPSSMNLTRRGAFRVKTSGPARLADRARHNDLGRRVRLGVILAAQVSDVRVSTPKKNEVETKTRSYFFPLYRASAALRTVRPRTCAPYRSHRSGQQSISIPINIHLKPNATAIVASLSSNSSVAAPWKHLGP
jgi:hypothetical protein